MDIQKEKVDFGDYCSIEQKRYGAPNEFYGYKVVGRLRSNSWVDTPVDAQDNKPKLHSEIVDVVQVISCTAGCDVVEQFRVSDLTRAWQQAQKVAVPEGFVLVESSELEYLKADSEYFEKSCVEWTNRAYEQRAKVDDIKNEVERFKQSGTSLDLGCFLESLIELSTFKRDAETKAMIEAQEQGHENK